MGSINTEDAARRLARVILSDIDLYNRERPKHGETLEAQIEQGRRLFASRVTPDLLPLFSLVLAERAVDRPKPAPSVAAPSLADQRLPGPAPAPAPAPVLAAAPVADQPLPTHAPVLAAAPVVVQRLPTPAPAPVLAAAPVAVQRLPTPAPAPAAPPVVDRPALTASVPATPRAIQAPAVVAQARPAAPPAPEIPIPVLTARVSIPRLLAVVSAMAATVAVLYHFLS